MDQRSLMDHRFQSTYRHSLPGLLSHPYFPSSDAVMKDMEYLQQMYPVEAKSYQKKIARYLDRIDGADSIMYDEYPDRFALFRIARDICRQIRNEEDSGRKQSEEKWSYIAQMIEILLYYEILGRRHQRKNRIVRVF